MKIFDFDSIVKNPSVFADGCLPAHADFVPYRNAAERATGESGLRMSLDGVWRFRYSRNPAAAPDGFWQPGYDLSGWDSIRVPAHIQMEGYDVPAYVNTQYPWDAQEELQPGEMPEVFTEILAYAQVRPVMMKGPAGTGKGFMSRKVAEALGAEFYEVNAVQNEYGLTGFVDANSRFVETPFYRACKSASEGKPTVFLFDEMDCSNDVALKIFNEALEAKEFTFPNNEKLEFKNLVILAACNTFGTGANEEYSGTRLDASTLNRFFVVTVGYERSVEMVMARHDVVLVDFIEAYRKAIETVQIKTIVSYRNIDMIAQMKGKLPMEKILKAALIKSLERDDVMMILNNMPEEVRNNNEYSKYLRKAA